MRLRPRFRFSASLAASAAFLLLLGTETHRRAFRARERALQATLDALAERVADLESRGLGALPPDEAVNTPGCDAVGGTHQSPTPQHRVLGQGRCAGWRYVDVRFADGEARRYYMRTNAPPFEARAVLDGIIADGREHVYTAPQNDENVP